jgi:hypothetical protein
MKTRKRKNKGGRPRKEGPREGNGRRDRKFVATESAQAATATAFEARERIYGMTKEQARDVRATSVIGRMEMENRLSRDQTDAARRYLEVRNAFQRAMGIKPEYVDPPKEGAGDGKQTYEQWCQAKRADHALMEEIIAEACSEAKTDLPRKALDMIVTRDIAVPPLEGDLRMVLNRLHRGLFAERRRKAA